METHEIITGTYSVEIKSYPSSVITSNTQTDVKDYAAVTTYYVSNPAYRNVTINNDASSTSYFSYTITFVNPNADNAVVNAAGASILAGDTESYCVFVDGNESASPITFYTGSTKKLTITGINSSFIHYSNDKTMAWVYVAADNTTINVKVTNS